VVANCRCGQFKDIPSATLSCSTQLLLRRWFSRLVVVEPTRYKSRSVPAAKDNLARVKQRPAPDSSISRNVSDISVPVKMKGWSILDAEN